MTEGNEPVPQIDDQINNQLDQIRAEPPVSDNSLGRLLTLSDGVFAIAMTLLALDLKVPDLVSKHPSDMDLRHALGSNSATYLSFLVSFYVIANYWMRHRVLMRHVVQMHGVLIRDTMLLLVLVAAMPFPASLLGRYGSLPISLTIYGAMNVLAVLTLMLMSWDIRRLNLGDKRAVVENYSGHWQSWLNLFVFALCIPAGYVLGHKGPYVLVLLAVPSRVLFIWRLFTRKRITTT